MQGVFDHEVLEVRCPECGGWVRVKVGEVRKSPTVTCPNAHRVKLDASGLDTSLKDVQKSIDGFMK